MVPDAALTVFPTADRIGEKRTEVIAILDLVVTHVVLGRLHLTVWAGWSARVGAATEPRQS